MLTLIVLAPSALAWEHMGLAWSPEDFPLEWCMSQPEEDSLPEGTSLPILQIAWDAWQDAECAAISNTYVDECANAGRNAFDGLISMHWDDPGDEIETGVLGVTYSRGENVIVKETATRVYRHFSDADIVFNDNVDFATLEDIQAGACSNEHDIQGVATHEIGHLHGMDHSCEDGDPCPDRDKAEATMYWSGGPCDDAQSNINADDITGISSLYGAFGYFVATTDRIGANPLDVGFDVVSDTNVIGARWNFGDGTPIVEEITPSHTYESAGQFTVQVEIDLEDETCGVSTYTYDELGFVLACDAPRPADGAEGFFTMEHDDGLVWKTINHSDVSVYGCIDFIAWEVYKGTSEADIKPENLVDLNGDGEGDQLGAWAPKIQFPAEGNYVVVMNVGGPGNLPGETGASFLTVSVADVAAEGGCDATGGLTASFGGLLLAAAAAARRRRNA